MRPWIIKFIVSGLLLTIFTSCASQQTSGIPPVTTTAADEGETVTVNTQADESFVIPEDYPYTYYLPSEEWKGLETSAYRNLDPAFVNYVHAHPQGTPDPDYIVQGTVPGITVETERTQYSLSRDQEIIVQISYAGTTDVTGQMDLAYIDRIMNLERWNGTEWERMLYVTSDLYLDVARAPHTVSVGNSFEKEMSLGECVTLLKPGKYRVVVYVNNTALYAEFELAE